MVTGIDVLISTAAMTALVFAVNEKAPRQLKALCGGLVALFAIYGFAVALRQIVGGV